MSKLEKSGSVFHKGPVYDSIFHQAVKDAIDRYFVRGRIREFVGDLLVCNRCIGVYENSQYGAPWMRLAEVRFL